MAESEPGSPHDLGRFLRAQDEAYASALHQVRAGAKRSHWMWYVFPQLAGLGRSATAMHYAIRDRAEARAYLEHPVLGPRLEQISRALLGVQGRSAQQVFGSPDDLKLRSCATLFAAVAPPGSVFEQVLERFFAGERDPLTLERLRADAS